MMGLVESKVIEGIVNIFESLKIYYTRDTPKGGRTVGKSDISFCLRGVYCIVEAKATEKSPIKKTQIYEMQKCREAGGVSFVVHKNNLSDFADTLGRFTEQYGDNFNIQMMVNSLRKTPCAYNEKYQKKK